MSTTHFGFEKVDESEKAQRVRGVFDSVASRYDVMNDLMSVGLHRAWKAYTVMVANVGEGSRVLDIAGGTGDLALAFSKKVGATGQVVHTWDVGSVDYDVATGEDRGVWFLGAKGLERLNPTTGEVQSWQSSPDGETPILIVVGSEGVWVGTYEGHLYFRPFE